LTHILNEDEQRQSILTVIWSKSWSIFASFGDTWPSTLSQDSSNETFYQNYSFFGQ